jgi:hypothetical protein
MTPVTLVSEIARIVDKLPKYWHIPHEDSLAWRQKAIYRRREIERWGTKENRRSRERTDKKISHLWSRGRVNYCSLSKKAMRRQQIQ